MERNPVRRKSNQLRADWRSNCRHVLANHLKTQLGISIEPNKVRLQPHADEGYAFLRQPEREHLFTKQLSKHSVGAYMELCREVGTSIEAIPHPDLTTPGQSPKRAKVSTSIINLSSQVIQQQGEITKLVDQLSQQEDQAQTEHRARQQAEERIRQLENDLTSTRTERNELRQEKMHLSSINKRLVKKMDQRDRDVKKALSALYRLEPDP